MIRRLRRPACHCESQAGRLTQINGPTQKHKGLKDKEAIMFKGGQASTLSNPGDWWRSGGEGERSKDSRERR